MLQPSSVADFCKGDAVLFLLFPLPSLSCPSLPFCSCSCPLPTLSFSALSSFSVSSFPLPFPPVIQLRGLGKRCELAQRVRAEPPPLNAIWRSEIWAFSSAFMPLYYICYCFTVELLQDKTQVVCLDWRTSATESIHHETFRSCRDTHLVAAP